MTKLIILFVCVAATLIFANNEVHWSRSKRDDGSYAADSGGPVAQESKSGGSDTEEPEIIEVDINPCELTKSSPNDLTKKIQPGSGQLNGNQLKSRFGDKEKKNSKKSFEDDVQSKFEKFVKKFNKTYATSADLTTALNHFKDNVQSVAKKGLKRKSNFDASFTVTKFSDISFDKFVKSLTGSLPHLDKPTKVEKAWLTKKRNCTKVSWTSLDVVPSVRQQDNCGCCYAMSTADLIGTQYAIQHKNWKKNYRLSSQFLADCSDQPAGYKCSGGRPVKVLEQFAKCKNNCKIPLESCYPYIDKNGTCRANDQCKDAPEIKVAWGKMLDVSGPDEKDLMASLLQWGPVVAIVGVSDSWQHYNGTGIIRPYQCTEDQNHAVLITGYDYSGCIPNYIVKNSWGPDWGGRGYIKLEAGANTCGIAKSVIVTCTKDCPTSDEIKHVLSMSNHPECV